MDPTTQAAEVNPLDALDDTPGTATPSAPTGQAAPVAAAEEPNPLDALDEQPAAKGTASAMHSALEQTGEPLPEVTISARGGPDATWSDVGSSLLPTVGAKIESKLAGVQEYRGNQTYNSARKRLWQSIVLPEAVRSARDKGIPLTEDDQVVDIARHLGIRPDQFTRDWPDYANQTPEERRDFQAAQRQRIQEAQPQMEEGSQRRQQASAISEDVRPNFRGTGLKSIAFDAATMIPDLLAGSAATMATGPVGGAAFMAADIAPDEYSAARNQGLDHRHAETYATLSTLAASVPEIPVFKILDSAPAAKKVIGSVVGEKFGATVPGKVIGTSVAQGVTQATVQALQEGIDEGLLDRHDTLKEGLEKIAAAGLTGAVVGAPLGGLHAAMHREPKEAPPGQSALEAAAAAAGPSTGQAAEAPQEGNRSEPVNPEVVPRETPVEAPAQAESALPAQRPIPALIKPEQAPPVIGKTAQGEKRGSESENLVGPDLRAALEAVDNKTVSPPQLEALERLKLATRNDVNVPRLLPAGRRELAKPAPETEQPPVAAANIPSKSTDLHPESTQNQPKMGKQTPTAPIEAPEAAKVSQIRPKRARPVPVEPDLPTGTPGNRYLEDRELRDALVSMKGETGWSQVGGRMLRNEETGQVTGRTPWIPNAEWWPERPKGLTEPQIHKAIDKAVAGEKLSPREQRMVDFMRDVHDQRQKLNTFLPEPADMPADYDLPKGNTVPVDDAHETALVARLAELDEGALESYAKQHEDDRQSFLRAVKAHLDAHDRQTAGASSESREEAAGVAEGKKGLDLFGQDTSRQQELADEIRRRDEARSPNKDVSADIGRPGDLFSTNANRQMDLTEGHRYESTQSAEGHDVGDIVRVDSPNNPHHGELAKIRSIFRHRQDGPFNFRVAHESGGQQTLGAGELEKQGQQDLVSQLEQARKETNTEPSDAQKQAGNYKKGTVNIAGMRVALENPRGSTRTGTSNGKVWRRKMHADYGYVKGTEGKDGDAVDVFLTGHPDSGKVFVINQNHPDGTFDEHKAVLGASSRQEAENTYLKHYPKDWKGLGSMAELTTEAFKEWVNSKRTMQPIRTSERRTDAAARKRVTEMTPEEMRKELLTHELTGIPNRRAYVEAAKLPTQVSIDVDSLKWVNDNMGHESGNALLKAIADSLSQHSDQVYHLSGDEFALQALHQREAHDVMAKVAEQLKGATIEVEMPDGKIVKLNGLGVSYGVGKDLHEADTALQTHKNRREKEGQRAPRGEAPPGATIGAREEGGKDKTGGVAEERTGLAVPGNRDDVERKLNDLLHAAVKRRLMEEQGQDLLDELSEKRITPRSVNDQFWKDTYWKLNAENQRRFQRYAKSLGLEPGSTLWTDREGNRETARDWQHVGEFLGEDLPADAGDLEGISRGYVALMKWANDQAEKASNESPNRLMLEEDAATYTPVQPVTGEVGEPRSRVAPGQGSLDLFAPRDNPTPAARAARAIAAAQPQERGAPRAGKTRTTLVSTGSFTSKVGQVRDWRDAAHIMAPLRKEPRESLMALVTDQVGRPLAIIRHTTGTTTASHIEPHTFLGAIARVPGAKQFWMAHNHPSGKIEQSTADESVAKRLQELSAGTGIELQGSIVVSPGNRYASFLKTERYKQSSEKQEFIRPMSRLRGNAIPIQERRLTRIDPLKSRTVVVDTKDALAAVKATKLPRGVVMLNARMQLQGHFGLDEQDMGHLRTGNIDTGAARIIKEFESANSQQAITFGENERDLKNLGTMLQLAGITVQETVVRESDGNLRPLGGGLFGQGRYFSQAQHAGEGMPARDVERIVRQTIQQSGLGANFPHVQVHGGVMTLPHDLRIHINRTNEHLAQALYDSTTGQIHLLAPNIHSELEARSTLWHEAVGHYGLRAAMDPARYNEVMDGIYRDMPERVRDTAYRNGLDLNDPTERRIAAEEVVAYAAGQIMTGQPVDKALVPMWTRVVRAVKAFFAKITGTPFYDDRAIAGLVQEAQTALERGTSFTQAGEAARSQHAERFYSPVERAVGESKQVKASAEQWLATIKKMPGVKPDELEWLGLEPWLKSHTKPITKAELEDYVRANRLELEETLYTKPTQQPLTDEQIEYLHGQLHQRGFDDLEADELAQLRRGGTDTGNLLEDLAQRTGIDAQQFREGGGISENERLQTRLAERLRAMGHQVVLDLEGRFAEFHPVDNRGGIEVPPQEDTEQARFNALPKETRDLVLELYKVSDQVAQERFTNEYHDDENSGQLPQYEEFTLPGGKHYHEMLLRLPVDPVLMTTEMKELKRQSEDLTRPPGDRQQAQSQLRALTTSGEAAKGTYRSNHWMEPNIVAHVRFNERTGADGKRVLFLEELQSDWHQAGRKRGYAERQPSPATLEALQLRDDAGHAYAEAVTAIAALKATHELTPMEDYRQRMAEATSERDFRQHRLREAQMTYDLRRGGVPDAPFKTSWPTLVMKRMVRWAAEHGFDRVAWTTGEQQNERYNLAKYIDTVAYDPRRHEIQAWNDQDRVLQRHAMPEELGEIIGEDAAKRLLASEQQLAPGFDDPVHLLEGDDLELGGGGMRGFYDDILPRETDKLIKKYGAKVGPTEFEDLMRESDPEDPETHANETYAVHGFDVTPQMRDAALSQGFPLFAKRQAPLPLQQPSPKGFYERVRKAVDWLMENPVTRDVRKLVNPVSLSAESKQAARVAREYLGKQAAWGQRSQEALEHFAREIDKWPVADQLEMMDRIERGDPQVHPELQPAADGMREMLDHWRDEVRNLGTGALDNFIENYFPHYWADPDKAQRLVASIQGRRPLKGPASFLKLRTIPTIKEGMDAGLKPLTVNPLVMALLKTREMQRFITGVTLMKRFKEDGLAVFLKSGKPMPDGWAPINDNSAKVRSWSEEEGGWIERGQYVMPEDAARVINNHVSQSWLKSFAPAQAFRVGANLLNALQLGFSAFHLGFTTLDAIISKTALGMESMLHGEVGKAARNFGEVALGPLAAVNNVRRGYNLLNAYTNPAGATPELAKIVKGLEVAGGRAHMDKYYMLSEGASPFRGVGVRSLAKDIHSALTQPTHRLRNVGQAVHNFAPEYANKLLRGLQALGKTHTPLEIPFEVAGRIVRASTSWIMEHLVPMQKLGVFADLAKAHIDRHPQENPNDQADALQRIWASVDNRLGEMVYDNLFWDRTFKDVLHFGIRAVGWNVGTVREIAGAPIDALKLVDKLISSGKVTADDVGHKIPYVLAMTMTTALYGAILNYLFTGEGPQEAKDYFFPRTGGETNYGTPQRVSLPSYVKDVYEYSQRPGHTVLNKLNPIFNVIGEMYNNEDFFGNPITDPNAGFWKSLEQRAEFVGKEATPFSLQGAQQLAGSEKPGFVGGLKRVGPYVGITPAPGYVTSPDQMERRERSEREKKYASHLKYLMNKAVAAKDTKEIARLRQEYIDAATNAKKTQIEVDKDKARSAVSRRKAATSMRQQGLPATANLVASLPLELDAAARQYFREQATV